MQPISVRSSSVAISSGALLESRTLTGCLTVFSCYFDLLRRDDGEDVRTACVDGDHVRWISGDGRLAGVVAAPDGDRSARLDGDAEVTASHNGRSLQTRRNR